MCISPAQREASIQNATVSASTVGSKKFSDFFFGVRLKMSCAKFGVDWARNVGGVGKRHFSGFRDFAKKTPVNLWV